MTFELLTLLKARIVHGNWGQRNSETWRATTRVSAPKLGGMALDLVHPRLQASARRRNSGVRLHRSFRALSLRRRASWSNAVWQKSSRKNHPGVGKPTEHW